jgi:hypothetical protein
MSAAQPLRRALPTGSRCVRGTRTCSGPCVPLSPGIPAHGDPTCPRFPGAGRSHPTVRPAVSCWPAGCRSDRRHGSPWFIGLTVSVVRQLARTDGLVGYSLRAQPLARTFSTLSAWTDEQSLAAFVREMPHRTVMARLRPHMGATLFTTWTVPGTSLPPSWDDAIERLTNEAGSPGRPRQPWPFSPARSSSPDCSRPGEAVDPHPTRHGWPWPPP